MSEASDIEMTDDDMGQLRIFMGYLQTISSSCDGRLERVELRVTLDGQDFVIGYGETGEPAVLIKRETREETEEGTR